VALEGYINDVDLSNTIDGRPIVYWITQCKATVPENASLVLLVNCSEIIVQNLRMIGIPHYAAIQLVSSINCSICNNVIKNDFLAGVYLRESSNNYIYGNLLESNWVGIVLGRFAEGSNNNLIWNNTFKDSNIGFWLIFANNNKIFHNNFIDNYQHARLSVSTLNNSWDDGYPSGGNFWSDYSGVDLYSGPFQNVTGSDGIGDSPYIIDENIVDGYPLMGPFGGLTFKGQNVTAYPSSEVCLIFENVTGEGTTSVNVTNVGPEPPSGFKLAGNYYGIKTTANYTGTINLRIIYDDSNMTLEEEMSLRLMQWDDVLQEWVDITKCIDAENNIVFGETTHLSIFAIFTPVLAPTPPVRAPSKCSYPYLYVGDY
jgi:parallel beta-helix repeat protein